MYACIYKKATSISKNVNTTKTTILHFFLILFQIKICIDFFSSLQANKKAAQQVFTKFTLEMFAHTPFRNAYQTDRITLRSLRTFVRN